MSKLRFWFRSALNSKSSIRKYYLLYSVVFVFMACICFSYFIFAKASLIVGDGWDQHFKALVYYAKYLRNIIRRIIFKGELVIPGWDFTISEGSDILNTLHYYSIGDPINLLAVFVPTKYMHYCYTILCILRLYLSGIAFSKLCFDLGKNNRYAVLGGALSYSLCYWGLLNAARHPYFINPMIYLPIMIMGIERILKNESPNVFILTCTISAASNFYFFYMIAVISVIYAIIRVIYSYKNIRIIINKLFILFGYAVVGVGIAGAILIPVLYMFINDSRIGIKQINYLLYNMKYYTQLPGILIGNADNELPFWLCLGVSVPSLFSSFLLFRQPKKILFKILFIICTLIMILPIGGRLLNGMSYMTNRWCWAFMLLFSYILVEQWDNLIDIKKEQIKELFIFGIVYYIITLTLEYSRTTSALASMSLCFIMIYFLSNKDGSNIYIKYLCTIIVLLINISSIALFTFSSTTANYVSHAIKYSDVWDRWNSNEARIIKNEFNENQNRYSGRNLTKNANMDHAISNTQYYWSISNPFVNDFRKSMSLRELSLFQYEGYDDRTTLLGLSSVKYFVTKNNDTSSLPFGYELIGKYNTDVQYRKLIKELYNKYGKENITKQQREELHNDTDKWINIYENKYSLPLSYCYERYINQNIWDKMNTAQKQQIQLSAAFMDKQIDNADIEDTSDIETNYTRKYSIKSDTPYCTKSKNNIITTENGEEISLLIDNSQNNSETYIEIIGLDYLATPEYELYFGDKEVDPMSIYNEVTWKTLSVDRQNAIMHDKKYWNPVQNTDITFSVDGNASKIVNYLQPEASFSSGRNSFLVNLGYFKNSVNTIKISFSKRGVYTYKKINVYQIDMNEYKNKIDELKRSHLSDLVLQDDTVSGSISLNRDKILCLAIPYSTGWNGYIDEVETDIFCINERYIGILVPSGKHNITFRYRRPLQDVGVYLSWVSIIIYIIIYFKNRKYGITEDNNTLYSLQP